MEKNSGIYYDKIMDKEFIERFRAALRIKTDWPSEPKAGDAAAGSTAAAAAEDSLKDFQTFLEKNYPAFNKNAERQLLSPYAVMYRWPGAANGAANSADPVLLMGHYDVVPAETSKWSSDPFAAELKDGYVYGRGALDMKNIIVEIMESAENLCLKGFKPSRDVWIVFGGDEERAGFFGAQQSVKWFLEKKIKFSFILDEGTPVAKDQIKGVSTPLALVGVEEKGYLSLNLTVEQKPGHASQPPEEQAAAILALAMLRLSRRPFPWLLTPAVEAFFRELSSHASGITAFVMKHARFFGPVFFRAAATSPATRALLRNTMAFTQLQGSAADNVMPSSVTSVINLRLLPPWTVEKCIERIKTVIGDDRVGVTVKSLGSNPVKAGPDQAEQKSPGWKEIKAALASSFPGVPVLPFLMPATTDSRHYQELSRYIFRFCPHLLNPEELSGVHGHDERISLENLEYGLKFYTALLEQL